MIEIPADFPVRPVADASEATSPMTCGTCELTWDDAIATSWTPVPGGRCPFEYFHEGDNTVIDFDDLTTDPIDNTDDTIDSRDVIARIEDIEDIAMLGTDEEQELSEELAKEYKALKALADEGSGYAADWAYGETLIHEDYFEDYYTELIQDTSDVKDWNAFPFRHIDWESVADEGKQDYTSIDFDGQTYYIR